MQPVHLADYLSHLTTDNLAQLVRYLPDPQPSDRHLKKMELIDRITNALSNPATLKVVWAGLSESDRASIAEAVNDPATPSVLDGRAYLSKHGYLPKREVAGAGAYGPPRLTELGLFLSAEFAVPLELAEALHTFLPKPPAWAIRVFESVPTSETVIGPNAKPQIVPLTAIQTEAPAVHDVLATLRLIAASKLKLSVSTMTATPDTLKALNAVLAQHEYPNTEGANNLRVGTAIRASGLVTLALAAGWATVSGLNDASLALTERGEAFLAQPSAQVLREGFTDWYKSGLFDELTRTGLHGAANTSAYYATPAPERRVPILKTLARMPAGRWIDVEDFFRATLITGNTFEVERDSGSHLWTGRYGAWNNTRLNDLGSEIYWRVVKCQIMLVMLFEPLACFGAVDIAYLPPRTGVFYLGPKAPVGLGRVVSRYDVLRYIRLTPLGEYLLGKTAVYHVPSVTGPALRVLPNQQIVVTSRLTGTASGHPVLLKFCERVSDDIYQMSRAKTIRTIEKHDMSAEEIVTYLERESGTELPQTVSDLLADIARRATWIKALGEALVFQVSDPALVLELEHDKTLVKLGCRRAGDLLIVTRRHAAAFRKRLRDLGYGVEA